MANLSRRDYLIRMGASAGAVIGAGKLDLFARETRGDTAEDCMRAKIKAAPLIRSTAIRTWSRRYPSAFPSAQPDQVVKLIFSGLMGFSWREAERDKFYCDVGFQAAGDRHHHHHLAITACENAYQKSSCSEVYPRGLSEKIEQVSFDVHDAMNSCKDVSFFQPGEVGSRDDLADHKDFRWIVDFESDYLYGTQFPEGLPKKKNVYKPVFTVKNGLFYTIRKTASTFRAQPADGTESYISELGSVADVIGANVYLNQNGFVRLTVNGQPYDVHAPGEIYFINHCYHDSAMKVRCKPEPYNMKDKKRRNDFFLHYKAFDRGQAKECELFMVEGYEQNCGIDVICHPEWFESQRLTDEAPCAGSGFGRGGHLP